MQYGEAQKHWIQGIVNAAENKNKSDKSVQQQADAAKEGLQNSAQAPAQAGTPSPENNKENNRKEQTAPKKTAKEIGKQIEKDLGKDARREFYDAKNGKNDRTMEQSKEDATQGYRDYGKEPPKWMSIDS